MAARCVNCVRPIIMAQLSHMYMSNVYHVFLPELDRTGHLGVLGVQGRMSGGASQRVSFVCGL